MPVVQSRREVLVGSMTVALDFNDAPRIGDSSQINPDREALITYLDVVFGYLEGQFPFRGFADNGSGYNGKPYNEWVDVNQDDLVNIVYNMAHYCAKNGTAAYCIPGTVAKRGQAKADDVVQTQVLVCDIDGGNIAEKLAHAAMRLGRPTLIVESGGRTDDRTRPPRTSFERCLTTFPCPDDPQGTPEEDPADRDPHVAPRQ